MPALYLLPVFTALLSAPDPEGPAPLPWGWNGHAMAARAAVRELPRDLPAFFLEAADQLVYLNSEADRWRSPEFPEMRQAWSPDHYVDVENLPPGALDAEDRYAFLRILNAAGIDHPERDVGLLPFRTVELYQRLVSAWRRWRSETDPRVRGWIEQRIVQDAGVLGHYVTDASQPHHTTIHFNGWAEGAPNPAGYTYDRSFHGRFETAFVDAHVRQRDIDARVSGAPRSVAGSARAAIVEHVLRSHAEVETLYALDLEYGFDPSAPAAAETRAFAADRLADGADMLRVLWWSAWLESAE